MDPASSNTKPEAFFAQLTGSEQEAAAKSTRPKMAQRTEELRKAVALGKPVQNVEVVVVEGETKLARRKNRNARTLEEQKWLSAALSAICPKTPNAKFAISASHRELIAARQYPKATKTTAAQRKLCKQNVWQTR